MQLAGHMISFSSRGYKFRNVSSYSCFRQLDIHINIYVIQGIYTYTHTHTSIHLCIHVYIYIYMYICIYTCIHMYKAVSMRLPGHAATHPSVPCRPSTRWLPDGVGTNLLLHVYMYVCVYIYTHRERERERENV